jgi:hypothetical protein
MMETRVKQHVAFDAIGRMGRDGLVFYDELISKLDAEGSYHKEARALGALLQSAPEKIAEILELAAGPDRHVRINSIHALGCCGRGGTEIFARVETRLRDQLRRCEEPVEWHALASALGHIAQSGETARALLHFLDQTDKQGTVIDALGRIGKEPEAVVPRLIECLDTFDEYDSDYCYHGEHERVTQALRGFGPSAAAAVPSLIQHVWTRPQQYWSNGTLAERPEPDQGVIEFLGEFGPAAKDALPALLEVQAQMRTQFDERASQALKARFRMRRTSMSRFDESLLLRRSTLHFGVAPADRAPVPVIGHWHPAFDADTHALCGLRGLRRKQALEKRHSASPVRCPSSFLRAGGRPGYTVPKVFSLRLDSVSRNKVRVDRPVPFLSTV